MLTGRKTHAEVTVALDRERQGEAALRLARALNVPLRLLLVAPTVETIPGDEAAAHLLPSGAAAAAASTSSAAAADDLAALAARLAPSAGDVPVIIEIARGGPFLLVHPEPAGATPFG